MKKEMSFNRKTKIAMLVFLAALLALLAACGGGGGNTQANSNNGQQNSNQASNDSKPIKIGVLATLSGPFSNFGDGIKKGVEIYLDQHDYKFGNHKVEVVIEDDENNPQVALRKYNKLIDQDKVDLIIGVDTSTVLYAIRDAVDAGKIPLIVSIAAGNDLSWSKKSDYIYRSTYANWQIGSSPAIFALEKLGKKKVYVVSYDNPGGIEQAEAFKRDFEAGGGQVVKIDYPKPGTSDFATYMTQIAELKPDLVFHNGPGPDGVRFVMQYKQFGFKDKIPLIDSTPSDQVSPDAMDAFNGVYYRVDFNEYADLPVMKKFMEGFKKKYGNIDVGLVPYGYESALLADLAIAKAGSVKSEDLIKVLKDISYDGIRGKVTMDPKTNNLIGDYFIAQYEHKNGKLEKNFIYTIKQTKIPEKDPSKK
jgi:branched-chain amino acid transport system substrate-binding protein